MVWSQFSIVPQFGVHFGNFVFDNSNWGKISHSLTKKSHTYEEGGAHLRISFWHLLMNFGKAEKSDFWKNEDIYWRYHHFTHVYQKPQSYEVQFLRYKVRQNFLSFWVIFCPFNPLPRNNPENQNFKEMKKAFGDVIILNLCNKKHDYMMYAYSNMECSHRRNFLSFQTIFCSFASLLTLKIKIWKKCKKTPGDIILWYTYAIYQDHMYSWYDIWFLRYEVQQTELFCHLAQLFALSPSPPPLPYNSPKNESDKNEKKP